MIDVAVKLHCSNQGKLPELPRLPKIAEIEKLQERAFRKRASKQISLGIAAGSSLV